jgi:hypothetical protein
VVFNWVTPDNSKKFSAKAFLLNSCFKIILMENYILNRLYHYNAQNATGRN